MSLMVRCMVATSMAVVLCGAAWGESGTSTKPKQPAPPKKETVYWIVVEAKNLKGEVNYEAIQYKEFKNRLARVHQDYQRAVDGWEKAKADAAKNKKRFDTPRPVEGYVKRVGEGTTYRSQADAKAAVQKILDQIEARKKAAEEKEKVPEPSPQ